MKRLFFVLALWNSLLAAGAAVTDALCGVWPVTDASFVCSLNGEWQLKVVPGVSDDTSVPEADASWGRIPVPGCWEAHGFCAPRYDYPDSLTGYYRHEFLVPSAWKGRHVVLRLDGVLRAYDLWINDRFVGSWESAYNTCQFDLTPFLTSDAFRGKPQRLALRVRTHFKGYEFDCFDDWAANGIFRDVTLMSVPESHVDDFRQETVSVESVDGMTGSARVLFSFSVTRPAKGMTLRLQVSAPDGRTVVDTDLPVDAAGKASLETLIRDASLWTAETPSLYGVRFTLRDRKGRELQTFDHRVGFRRFTIEKGADGLPNILCLNGRPIKLRGVNAHATDPRTVKVIGDTLTLRDMNMWKAASVNFLRLSHYPREPRFFELADSMGFYLVDEVPFGYGTKHLNDTTYEDILRQRAQATVRRDAHHPSVMLWSVGNENPLTAMTTRVGEYVRELDPTRDICYPQVGSYFRRLYSRHADTADVWRFPEVARVYAPHYPTTDIINTFHQQSDRPIIFTEYCHTLGSSFEDHNRQWEIIERTPHIAGGAVWEWADQGMPVRVAGNDGERPYGYEERVVLSDSLAIDMHGDKGTDGLVYADRTPLPNYYELQHNYARAAVEEIALGDWELKEEAMGDLGVYGPYCGDTVPLRIRNRYDFVNLKDNVRFRWTLMADRDTVDSGVFSPDCVPHSSTVYRLGLPRLREALASCYTEPHEDQDWVVLHLEACDRDGRVFLRQSVQLAGNSEAGLHLLVDFKDTGDPTELFQTGWLMRVGRKSTLAEEIKVKDSRVARYLLPLHPVEGTRREGAYNKEEYSGGNADFSGRAIIAQDMCANTWQYYVNLFPDTTGNRFLSELGIAFLLDSTIDRVQWVGSGPYATVPGRQKADQFGIWALHKDDLYFEGNRMNVNAALFTDSVGNGLLILGDASDISFEQTDCGIVVSINSAVSGSGPKFACTAFPVWAEDVARDRATGGHFPRLSTLEFQLYRVKAGDIPARLLRVFSDPRDVPAPFRPFQTQYDSYLMRYEDITARP